MEITININGNSEYELYNEFMDKLLKLRKSNKTAKTTEKRFFSKRSLREQFKTIPPFCIKTAESAFPAEYKDIAKDSKKLWPFVNNLRTARFIKTCGYTKPKGSTRLYVSYCGVDYNPDKAFTVEADGTVSVDPQLLNWNPFSLGGDLGTIKPGRNLIVASSGVLVSKEFALDE